MRQRTTGITLFLIKPGLDLNDVIKGNPHRIAVRLDERHSADLYVKPSIPVRPQWLELFQGRGNLPPDLWNQHSAAVLLVRTRRRLFALTYGYGRMLLQPGSWEEDFGLKVTLNSIGADGLQSVERLRFDAINSRTLSQTSRRGSAEQFGVEPERELLRAVAGVPENKALGSTIAGAESLRCRVPRELGELPNRLHAFRKLFESRAYEAHFPWVGQITEVKSPALLAALDGRLTEALRHRRFDHLYLAVPHIIDWNVTAGFRYSEKGETKPDLDIREFIARERDPASIDAGTLRSRRVFQVIDTSDVPFDSWSTYKSVDFETTHEGATYLLTSGKWFEVNGDFVADTENRVRKVKTSAVVLPPYDDATETAYNKRVAVGSNGKFALMDCRLVARGGGRSKIEFCDLYEKNERVIHVKRWGGSSTLSHLFAQGEVSAMLFLEDPEFRRRVNGLLPTTHRLGNPDHRPAAVDFEIVFAIVSRSQKSLYQSLPFFSKLDLLAARDRLKLYGFEVGLAKIDVA